MLQTVTEQGHLPEEVKNKIIFSFQLEKYFSYNVTEIVLVNSCPLILNNYTEQIWKMSNKSSAHLLSIIHFCFKHTLQARASNKNVQSIINSVAFKCQQETRMIKA